jgi:hypothetical protein
MQQYYIYTIFITNLGHDIFSCINDCSHLFRAQLLAFFREPASSSMCALYVPTYMAEIPRVQI